MKYGWKRLIKTITIICLLYDYDVECKKIVVLVPPLWSNILPVLNVAKELEKYNHSATFVFSTAMDTAIRSEGISVQSVIAKSFDNISMDMVSQVVAEKLNRSWSIPFSQILKRASKHCHNFMTDDELFQVLSSEKFAYAIIANAPGILCYEILAYKLSLPFVFIGAHYDSVLNRIPFNPATTPALWSGFTDKMTFKQRVLNSLFYIVQLIKPTMPSFENLVSKYVPEKSFISNSELKNSFLLQIIDGDILIDYPLLTSPNVILCGGLGTRPAKPLSSWIEKFVEKSIEGIVIVSFGSIIKSCSEQMLNTFLLAFQKTKRLSFIFQYGYDKKEIGNTLLLPWLPQNDLLGHVKTKLFITHCGKSSVFEALYHGIPMIGFPIVHDQGANAAMIEDKGYGISMDILKFSVDELVKTIEKVAFNKTFISNIKVASEIFHSRPQTPSQRAAYWIDLVIKYGKQHFRPSSLDMPWYSYYMFDIYLFFTVGLVLGFYCFKLFLKFCYLIFRRKQNVKGKLE
ncbi:UGT [Mytilus coruscus]|uniref:UDP-glucuronosyltransferase n=1 Tax=Mytilus coruscus TaxID=42192 RepID=A0A6J8CXL3_MYTCO|nr:UGT [Mytilus coruscus]